MTNTIIKTFDKDIYIIKGKNPDQVAEMIEGMDEVRMPNGARVNRKAIATMQDYDDYTFQAEQKQKHRKGQYLHSGVWHDEIGSLAINAHLERITGDIQIALPTNKKKLNAKKD